MPEIEMQDRSKKRRHRSGPPLGREWRHMQKRLEIRSVTDAGNNTLVLEGSPIVYNTPYVVWDMFGEFEETMMPGVATNLLASPALDVRFLFNHDGMPLARTTNGTLLLTDTPEALNIRVIMDARSQMANDLAVAIERGDVDQMSCGFVVGMDTWNADYTQRSIFRFEEFFDVSAVTYPASPTTSIEMALRSLMAAPIESRARLRVAYKQVGALREGKVLSNENATLLQNALEALHEADDIDIPAIVESLQTIDSALDAGQAGLSQVLGKADPDGDADDREPELSDGGEDNDDGSEDTAQESSPGAAPLDGSGMRGLDNLPSAERRTVLADMTYNDVQEALNDALNAKYQSVVDDPTIDCDWVDCWVRDNTDDWLVWKSWGPFPDLGLWQAPFVIDESGNTVIGEPTEVAQVTSYAPVAPSSARTSNVLALEAERLRLRRRTR